MKHFLLTLFVALFVVFCVACGGDSATTSTNTDTSSNTDTSVNTDTAPQPVEYTITWFDENGIQFKQDTVIEGNCPSLDYEKADTAEWDYTFEGWSLSKDGEVLSSIPVASEDASYYAIVSKVKQKYTVIFNSNGGSEVESQVVEYGALATLPEEPTYDGHKFMGWCVDENGEVSVDFNNAITENTEYYAIWNVVIDAKSLLQTLLNGYELNPYSSFPETMIPGYTSNLVGSGDIVSS